MIPHPTRSTLFPYTTLFRSSRCYPITILGGLEPARGGRCGSSLKHSVRPRNLYFQRSEEHTSELQSHSDLVCRLLLEKKKTKSIPEDTADPFYEAVGETD